MRLTTFTDYTIRVLIYLGLHTDRLTTAAELAERYQVSRNHLTKVVHFLAQQGYIDTLRGKGGGIRLARKPHEIRIGILIRDSERDSLLVECFNKESCQCRILPACRLTGILREAEKAFFQVLDGYTLADLIRNDKALDALLAEAIPGT
ncbi:MAG: Rrf2 family transcriptional regulator [Sedimenticola sp.]|nr:Rrf2 family transcriptional regulator [Sedimenticola sp.]